MHVHNEESKSSHPSFSVKSAQTEPTSGADGRDGATFGLSDVSQLKIYAKVHQTKMNNNDV